MTVNEKRQSSATSSSAVMLCYSAANPHECFQTAAVPFNGNTHHIGNDMPTLSAMLPSKYLKQSDVINPQILTISDIDEQVVDTISGERKWVISFAEIEKPMVMNGTNLRAIATICGSENTDHWMDQKVVVFNDPSVSYAGRITGGLRVRAPKKPTAVRPSKAAEESEWAGQGVADMPGDSID